MTIILLVQQVIPCNLFNCCILKLLQFVVNHSMYSLYGVNPYICSPHQLISPVLNPRCLRRPRCPCTLVTTEVANVISFWRGLGEVWCEQSPWTRHTVFPHKTSMSVCPVTRDNKDDLNKQGRRDTHTDKAAVTVSKDSHDQTLLLASFCRLPQ